MESRNPIGNFFKILFNDRDFLNLKLSILFFVFSGFFLMNLLESPVVQLNRFFVFDEVSNIKNNFFYSYFLDFSTALSSSILIFSFVIFVWGGSILLTQYVGSSSSAPLFLLIGLTLLFTFMMIVVIPISKNIEKQILFKTELSESISQKRYLNAYAQIEQSNQSEYLKAYMSTQVAILEENYNKSEEYKDILEGEIRRLNDEYVVNESLNGLDKQVFYAAYSLSEEKDQLQGLQEVYSNERIKAMSWLALLICSLLISMYQIKVYKREVGI